MTSILGIASHEDLGNIKVGPLPMHLEYDAGWAIIVSQTHHSFFPMHARTTGSVLPNSRLVSG